MHCQYGRDISQTNAYYLISRAGPKCIEHAAEGVSIEYERHLDGDLSLTQGLKMISTEDDSRVRTIALSALSRCLLFFEWVHLFSACSEPSTSTVLAFVDSGRPLPTDDMIC